MVTIIAWLLAALAGLAHPESRSSSRIAVGERTVEVEHLCESLSLIECLPIDADSDGRLDDAELAAGREAICAYVQRRYEVLVGRDAAAPLPGECVELARVEADGAFALQRVRIARRLESERTIEELTIRVSLFREANPQHRDVASLTWRGEAPIGFLFAESNDEWRVEPLAQRRAGVFGSYVRLGLEHIAGGYDHLAFLLGLIVAARRLRSLVGVVTAFTVAHSITLACAALDVVSAPARLVELAIALSIAYVGAETLLLRRPATRWLEALGFGLIHGLGFAGFLADSLMAEPLVITALVGFNLGVELGQLGVVVVAALVIRALPGDRSFEAEARAWLAPRWLRIGGSAAALVAGLYWFVERAGWIG